ncbi:response regulator transcription factor [Parasphingorhabdus sp.]|uniref:response regulator transcription factor n=1 Tax=Parasphingorhabdus sp. TaxID=2709688 RepID=UPI003266633D
MKKYPDLRVLVAEDQALVRQGIVALIEHEVGEVRQCANGGEALHLIKQKKVDLALLDIGLPERTGLDILTEIKNRELDIKVIVLTGDTASYSPASIYRSGADAFLYKTTDAENFLDIFNAVAGGRVIPNEQLNEGHNAQSIAELRETLTDRELQIIKLVVEGASNQKASEALCISEHTVRKHREHINRKLKVHSPASLAAFAIKASLV